MNAGGSVGEGEDRPQVGSEKDVEGPAASSALLLDETHHGLVDIGPRFPVDLDADEMAVEEFGGDQIGERLAGHDVAPVAGRVADRNEKRLVLRRRRGQRFGAPFLPPHRIAPVLPQVR